MAILRRIVSILSCLFIVLAFLSICFDAEAVDIVSTGSCLFMFVESDTVRESAAGAASLSITGTRGSSDRWRVDVRLCNPGGLHDELKLLIKRCGNGSGRGGVLGGDSYSRVGLSDRTFFRGHGDRFDIPLRFKLAGLADSLSQGRYSVNIIYTVVNVK